MKIAPPHFTVIKGKTHYFHLAVVVVVGIFVVIMVSIYTFVSTVDLNSWQSDPFLPGKKTTLTLEAPQTEIKEGDTFPVNVFLDANLPTTGVDIALEYNPIYLELAPQGSGNASPALNYLDTTLSIMDIFPFAELKTRSDNSVFFRFSAVAKPLKEFKGRGVVATLSFKAVKRGETDISLLSEKGSGSDSNVAYLGKDILTGTKNLRVKIR